MQEISGDAVFHFITGHRIGFYLIQEMLLILSLIMAIIFIINEILFYNFRNKSIIAVFVFIAALFFQVLITSQATGPHHLSVLSPVWLLIISLGLHFISQYKFNFGYFILNGRNIALLFVVAIVAGSLVP